MSPVDCHRHQVTILELMAAYDLWIQDSTMTMPFRIDYNFSILVLGFT